MIKRDYEGFAYIENTSPDDGCRGEILAIVNSEVKFVDLKFKYEDEESYQEIHTLTESNFDGRNSLVSTESLSSGIYYIHINTGSQSETKRIIKL